MTPLNTEEIAVKFRIKIQEIFHVPNQIKVLEITEELEMFY